VICGHKVHYNATKKKYIGNRLRESKYVFEQLKFEKYTTNIFELRVQNRNYKVVKSEKRKNNLFYSVQYEEYNMDKIYHTIVYNVYISFWYKLHK